MTASETTLERRRAAVAKARKVKSKRKNQRQNRPKPTAIIRPEEMYPFELVPALFGIGIYSLRRAEREGLLKTKRFGSRKFVSGEQLVKAMESIESASNQPR